MFTQSRLAWLVVSVVVALAACGGGATPPETPPNSGVPTVPSPSAGSTLALGSASAILTLPAVGGYASTLAVPASNAQPGTQLTVTASLDAPAGFTLPLTGARRPQSTGSLTFLFYLACTSNHSVTFPSLPALTVALPATFSTRGKQLYYGISDPTVTGVALQFRTEGPATVSGRTANFGSSSTPLILVAKKTYIFAVYAVSAQPLVFVSNAANDSITAYPLDANGDIAPVRTIAGVHTRLNKPGEISQDSAGNLYVANAGANYISVYPAGADGDVMPARTIVLSGVTATPVGVAVTRLGDIYVSTQDYLAQPKAVLRYAPTASGNATPIDSALTYMYPVQLNLDTSGNVYSPYDVTEHASGGVAIFSPSLQQVATIQGPYGDASALDITKIYHPMSSAVDGSNRLLIAQYNTVLAFARFVPQAKSNIAPLFILDAGPTQLVSATTSPDGRLFLASDIDPLPTGGVPSAPEEVIVYPAGLKADSKPIAHIAGPATRLAMPAGIAIGY